MPTRRDLLKSTVLAAAPAMAAPAGGIQHIDIIHHSHTDVGYTDMPSVCRDLQVRFLDAALDTCLRNPHFRWTAEATLTVGDWWRGAAPARRAQLVKMVEAGQMDVCAMPFNQTPFMNAAQWRQALDWLPADVQRDLKIRIAMQNDVNGMPRAGALLLLDRGIHQLLMGINADMGGPPFRRPSAFWWKMPDGRRMFVWLGDHYGTAYSYFEPKGWQHGQAKGATTTLRPPYSGDMLKTDEESLRAAHAQLTKRLEKLQGEGYGYRRLLLSYTNQWRYDNDPPFPPLAPFIDAWNKMGMQPTLRLATATQAVQDMETELGSSVRTYEGEWTDWWANGDASGPREVAASRLAKRQLDAALSPVWGEPTKRILQRSAEMYKDLCLFDEHTWGANVSVSQPDSLDTHAQFCEKGLLAYKPMGHSEWLLGQRARTHFCRKPAGLYAVNTAPLPYSGWVRFPGIQREPQWVDALPARSAVALGSAPVEKPDRIELEKDAKGWPVSARWPGMRESLFSAGLGDILSVYIKPEFKRSSSMHPERLARMAATYGPVKEEKTPYTVVYTQPIVHRSFASASRRLELFHDQPRATLSVQFDRLSNLAPEVLYMLTEFPAPGVLPRFCTGGVPFTPFEDQLPGSCRDYFAIDSWAHYGTPGNHWLWVTRDAPLVTVGGPHTWLRIQEKPADPQRLWTMLFDNFWHTNFVANSHGVMEFQFELAWTAEAVGEGALAQTLLSVPIVVDHPAVEACPELMKALFNT